MDTATDVVNDKNHGEKTDEVQLLVPSAPQAVVIPMQNDANGLLKPVAQPIRSRKSFCTNPELTGSRRPSAIIAALQQDHRTPSSGNIFFE